MEPVRVEVTDVNAPPAFAADTVTLSVPENVGSYADIGEPVAATDPDDGDSLTYTWGGADASSFDVLSYSGQVQTLDPLDYETRNSYSITVSVSDGKDADGNADDAPDDSIDVTITVTDANDPPAFAAATATRTIAENTAEGENIGDAITATDQDSGDTLTYSLGVADTAFFDLVETTGQLQTKAALDYETKSSYIVTVSVKDSKDDSGVADTAEDDSIEVTITVTNADEDGTVTLLPAQPQVGVVLTASLADPDGAVSGTTWVWESSADGSTGWTTLNGASSTVTTSSYTPVTADLNKYLRATASYTDPESSGKSANAVSANAVQAALVTNLEPDFPSTETGARSVAENTAAGTDIGAPVAATDANSDTLTYSIGGTESAPFTIISTSGQLQTKAALDYETKSSYIVTVSVKDSKDDSGVADTAEDDSIEVTITVTNADEDGTVTLLPAQPQVGVVLTASLADPDGAVSGTTWVWESSADGSTGWTTLNGASSTVTTSSYTPVTADLNKYLRATASYTDPESSGKSANAVSANAVQAALVTNLEPDFPSTETGARTVAENTAAGEPIGSPVAATDADNDPLTYSFDVPSTAFFTIDSASGQLRTKADLDYETKSSYTVTVSVHDGKNATGGADTTEDDSIEVTITVTDVNEAPEFPSTETGARSVAENTAVGENIGDAVTATDQDSGDTLTYSLGVADTTFFDIVETTGQLQTKAALDYETKDSYTVTVSVGDSKDAAGATDTAEDDSIEVTITVTNADEDGTVTLLPALAPGWDGVDRQPE